MPQPIIYTADDWEIAGRTLFGEARNQPFRGQVAVAWVIRNRVERPGWWGHTAKEVCLKPWQFSSWNEGDPNREVITTVTSDNPGYRRALGIVALVFSGDIADVTGGSDHYHTTAKPPSATTWPPVWAKSLRAMTTIGAHVFLRPFRGGDNA